MVSRLFFIPLACLCFAPAWLGLVWCDSARGDPATQPLTSDTEKQKEELATATEASKYPIIKADSLSAVIHFSIVADMLVAEQVSPPDKAGQYHILLPSPHLIATLREIGRFRNRAPVGLIPRFFAFIARDFSDNVPDQPQTTVISSGGRVQIVREFEYDTPEGHHTGNVTFMQDPPPVGNRADTEEPVRLMIQRTTDPPAAGDVNIKLSALTFTELRRRNPRELDRFLRPIFRDFGQEAAVLSPDAAAAWQVLSPDFTPDPGAVSQVKSLVEKLNADTFADRRSALQSLHDLGERAAMILMRADRTGWSVEQVSAIDTFLTPYLPLTKQDAKRLNGDASFLLNLQYVDDVDLRVLAAAKLSAITGRPTPFDPRAADADRISAVEHARPMLDAATKPTS